MNNELQYIPLIIPTVLIPFTLVSVGISVAATFIAGLFGIQLKAEGPKQLLEVLLRPKVLITAVIFNIASLGIYKGYLYVKYLPSFKMTIDRQHKVLASKKIYQDMGQEKKNFNFNKAVSSRPFKLTTKWSNQLATGSFRSGVYNNGSIFIAMNDGHTREISYKSGKVIRDFFTGTMIAPNPTIYDQSIYVGEGTHETHHARAYRISLSSGKHLGSYQTLGHIEGPIAIAEHNNETLAFVVSGKDGLHAIDPKTMKKRWHQNPGHIDAGARVQSGIVYVGTGRERGDPKMFKTFVAAYDFSSGKELWIHETAMSSWMSPILTSKYVCHIFGEVYFKSKMGALNCYNKNNGEPAFSVLMDTPLIGQPIAVSDDIMISDIHGKVCRISTLQKEKIWCHDTKSKKMMLNTMSFDPKTNVVAYATPHDGIHFLDFLSGKMLHHYKPKGWQRRHAGALVTPDGWITISKKGQIERLDRFL